MLDASLTQTIKGYDFNIVNGDIEAVGDFKTAIEVSLFSDARADRTQIYLPEKRRGWIGDAATTIEGQNYGSLLWLVQQERLTQSTLNKCVSFVRDALQWMIDQGQASAVDVTGSIVPTKGVAINIQITAVSGNTENHYVSLWEATINAN